MAVFANGREVGQEEEQKEVRGSQQGDGGGITSEGLEPDQCPGISGMCSLVGLED